MRGKETQCWGNEIHYQATLVTPNDELGTGPCSGVDLPMLVFFIGMGLYVKPMDEILPILEKVARHPFVLVTPVRPDNTWWFIAGGGQMDWCQGEFLSELRDRYTEFIADLSRHDGIDGRKVV